MLLLVTGASGAGKSTVRERAAGELPAEVECVELAHLVSIPARPTIAWRQQATEVAVQRALILQPIGRHVLLAGDPVAAGEVVAAPSADRLEAVAVCLLDIDAEAQAARLSQRGDDPRLLADHQAFAAWMRGHAKDPRHMPEVLTTNGWDAMCWDRLKRFGPDNDGWDMHVIDTSARGPEQVADDVVTWCRRALRGHDPQIRATRPPARQRT